MISKRLLISYLVRFVILLEIGTVFYPILGESSPSLGVSMFQLDILKSSWREYEFHQSGNTPEKLLSVFKDITLSSESCFHITENDIENYNWPDQSILLTWEASARFMSTFIINMKELNLETAKRNAERTVELGFYINGGVFVVSFKGDILYGGAIDNMVSSGYKVPTLFIQTATLYNTTPIKRQLRFVVRPLKIMVKMLKGYQGLEQQLKDRIEKQEVHNFFYDIHKLTDENIQERVKPWLPELRPRVIEYTGEKRKQEVIRSGSQNCTRPTPDRHGSHRPNHPF